MRLLFLICAVVLTVNGELVDVKYCDEYGSEKCTIDEIRVDPCSTPKRHCRIKRGNNASIEFDFTPKFAADKLESIAVWSKGPNGPIEFAGMDKDACKFTNCPSVQGGSQTYTYSLRIGKKIPTATYPLEWKLYDASNTSNMCCFQFSIRIQ